MTIYCTICCKDKSERREPLKTIERYKAARIHEIYAKSIQDEVGFRILSGKYGLLNASDHIPYYDLLLKSAGVNEIVRLLASQLRVQGINTLVFFGKDPKEHPTWEPYTIAIERSCLAVGVKLVKNPLGSGKK